MFALCFIIGLPHVWRTFPNCRVKLFSHSLRAIILQMPSPWGFNSHFLVFLKSKCVDGMTSYSQSHSIHLLSPLQDNFQSMIHLFKICLCICGIWFKFSLFFNSFICVLMHLLGLLHCCTPPMIIKWSIDENKYSILTYY